ncbi:MAG: fructose-6-phosphate aldolase [Candidatus Omnitrophota bacterium]|jgi:transaldolase
MRIFIDTAKIEEIKEAASWGVLDGVTTNPTLVAKTGKGFDEVAKEIIKIVDGPISLEAISQDTEGIIREARQLSKIHKNIVVKIPITEDGLAAITVLAKEQVKTNVTLVFSPTQALLAAKAGATYVSPFVGRLDDISQDGMAAVSEILSIFRNYSFSTEVIVASIRHPMHVVRAALMGAHIATCPFTVLKALFKHPLTDIGIKRFLEDWDKVPKK